MNPEPITYMLAGSYSEARHVAKAQRLTGNGFRPVSGQHPWIYCADPDALSGLRIESEQVARCYGYYERADHDQFEDCLRYAIVKKKGTP
jgi:hypothetical protein